IVRLVWRRCATIKSTRERMEGIGSEPRLPQTLGDGRLVSAGVKLYIDGSGGARAAWRYDEWNKDRTGTDTGNKGYPANGESYPAIYKQQVMMLTEAGINVCTHAGVHTACG